MLSCTTVSLTFARDGVQDPKFYTVTYRSRHGADLNVHLAAAFTMPPDANDPFGVPTASFEQDLVVNASSAYAGLYHATQGFLTLKAKSKDDSGASPYVYIATGNVTPFQPNPVAVTLGSGKAALAYLISVGALAYNAAGYR